LTSSSTSELRRVRGALVPCAFAMLAGCPTDPGTGDGGLQHCEIREQCSGGQVCTQDRLCADCISSGECRLKEECRVDADAGVQRCALRSGWGTECERNGQCSAGKWCVQGLCRDSTEVRVCPAGTSAECLPGQRCNTINFACEQDIGCSTNADCSAAEVCNAGTNQCVPRCTLETQLDLCLGGERCVNEMCVQCASNSECSVGLFCDAAGKCVAEPRCYQDRDCKVPLVCHLQTGTCVEKPPPCTSDETCAPDQRCYLGTGKCIPRSCQPDRFEPDEEISTARAMTPDLYPDLTLCTADVDVYAFNLARGDLIGVILYADPYAENTFTTLVQDAFGRTLASGKLVASYVASSPATYYVSISTTDAYQPYDVKFLLTRGIPCVDDVWEPNDFPTQATRVNTGELVDGAICPQDSDHFSVVVPSGNGLQASLGEYQPSGGLLRLCMFVEGIELRCSDDPPSVTATGVEVGGKTVVVRVNAADPRVANGYTLLVEFL
jgi:hypothetical protein